MRKTAVSGSLPAIVAAEVGDDRGSVSVGKHGLAGAGRAIQAGIANLTWPQVNGDNDLAHLKSRSDSWKVRLGKEDFFPLMFGAEPGRP
ncbi:hypothetical protein [Chloracidobacterium thermophilum]|jgi:hypothetical protein|uniref:Uncharacterized protein n=2 Tax=Acidobacteriaceae TaxID=204434 RepID=G2LKI2_CHLTF|nr:hypothetical protein [Chloracidobacterium thermophilum]AEP13268.1 hypothetical protein Cabther_B0266 [Chloracidobacterium thermophilum B]